jgi:anti-repressor protein
MTHTTNLSAKPNGSLAQKNESVNELQIIEKDGIQAVSARELYKGLEITERFSNWFNRICAYGFVENEDFLGCKVFNTLAKQELQDYVVSLDMAKQICMLQRSELGKKYRNYLIKLEKAWNTPEAVMARALQVANQTLDNIKQQVAIMQPKAVVYDELVDRSKTMNFRDMAAKLGFTQKEFMTILKAKYIYKNSIGEYRAYSEYQQYFTLRTYNISTDKTGEQLLLNMNGITYFINKYNPQAIAESYIEKQIG